MNFIKNIFNKKSPEEVILYDDDFGVLKYDHDEGWDGIFSVNNENIDIGIGADINGPTEKQKNIWRNIKNNIDKLNDISASIIRKEIEKDWPEEFQHKVLSLFNIVIYHEKHHGNSHFLMCYSLEDDLDGIHRVDYKDMKPLYYGRDD